MLRRVARLPCATLNLTPVGRTTTDADGTYERRVDPGVDPSRSSRDGRARDLSLRVEATVGEPVGFTPSTRTEFSESAVHEFASVSDGRAVCGTRPDPAYRNDPGVPVAQGCRLGRTCVALALVAVLLTATSACSDRVYADGPFGESGDEAHAAWCLPHEDGKTTITANNGPLPHGGRNPVTITGVSAVGAQGFRVTDAVVTPKNGTVTGAAYPPPSEHAGPTWDRRVAAEGATIAPGETWWLIVGLRAEADQAGVERFQVDYRDDAGARYRFLTGSSIYYLPDCDEPWQGWREGE